MNELYILSIQMIVFIIIEFIIIAIDDFEENLESEFYLVGIVYAMICFLCLMASEPMYKLYFIATILTISLILIKIICLLIKKRKIGGKNERK